MSTVSNTNIVGTKTGPELVTELNTQIGNTDTELDLRPEIALAETITGAWDFSALIDFAAGVNVAGNVDVTSGDLVMAEKAAHTSTPVAAHGYLWTKNTVPSTLIFTNDDGTDFTLGTGAGGSLGITDNATAERLLIADTLITVGASGTDTVIARKDSTKALVLSAGTSGADGPYLKMDGATNDVQFMGGAGSFQAFYDHSKWAWYFYSSVSVDLGVWGNSNASSLQLISHCSSTSTDTLTKNGAWIELFANNHATTPNDITFNAGAEEVLSWNENLDAWDFQAKRITNSSADNNVITGTSYTLSAANNGQVLIFTNSGAIPVTLPDTLAVNFHCTIVQAGAGVPTVTPNTDTINGAGTGVAPSAQWKGMYLSQYSATNWLALI